MVDFRLPTLCISPTPHTPPPPPPHICTAAYLSTIAPDLQTTGSWVGLDARAVFVVDLPWTYSHSTVCWDHTRLHFHHFQHSINFHGAHHHTPRTFLSNSFLAARTARKRAAPILPAHFHFTYRTLCRARALHLSGAAFGSPGERCYYRTRFCHAPYRLQPHAVYLPHAATYLLNSDRPPTRWRFNAALCTPRCYTPATHSANINYCRTVAGLALHLCGATARRGTYAACSA